VALADLTGDGTPDVIAAAGPGGGPHVKVFDGATGAVVREFFAYGAGFTGGVFVAAADLNGDGTPDIITGAGPGGGPDVKVFGGANGALLTEFFAYDKTFTGGVRVAAISLDAAGRPDIVTSPGAGGGADVRVFTTVG